MENLLIRCFCLGEFEVEASTPYLSTFRQLSRKLLYPILCRLGKSRGAQGQLYTLVELCMNLRHFSNTVMIGLRLNK